MNRITLLAIPLLGIVVGGCATGQGATQSPQPSAPAAATPSPSRSAIATPVPSTSPIPYPLEGPLTPGRTYYIEEGLDTPGRLTFTVPAPGWSASHVFIDKHHDQPTQVGLSTWIISHVYADVCQWQGNLVDAGETVEDLVSVLADQKGQDVSAQTDVELGGYPAKRIDMTVEGDLDVTTCDMDFLRVWPGAGPDETQGLATAPGITDVMYIVDVDGKRLALVATHHEASSEADLAELDQLIASIRIDPPSEASSPSPSQTP